MMESEDFKTTGKIQRAVEKVVTKNTGESLDRFHVFLSGG